jgi:hypothetical protein
MLFSRAWWALMRRNLIYRKRHWINSVSGSSRVVFSHDNETMFLLTQATLCRYSNYCYHFVLYIFWLPFEMLHDPTQVQVLHSML